MEHRTNICKIISALAFAALLSACGSEETNISGLNPVAAPTPAIAINFAAAASNAAEANAKGIGEINHQFSQFDT